MWKICLGDFLLRRREAMFENSSYYLAVGGLAKDLLNPLHDTFGLVGLGLGLVGLVD